MRLGPAAAPSLVGAALLKGSPTYAFLTVADSVNWPYVGRTKRASRRRLPQAAESGYWGDSDAQRCSVKRATRMADTLTPSERSERMSRVRGKDTKPEMIVRGLTHGMGYRYRLHRRTLPGAPDLVFPSRRKVIFIHGCFWHRHSDPACKLARLPRSRLDFWLPKLEGNHRRDIENQEQVRALGWQFLVVWECETRHREQLANTIRGFLEAKTCSQSSFLQAQADLESE